MKEEKNIRGKKAKKKKKYYNYIFLAGCIIGYLTAILLVPGKTHLINSSIIKLFIKIFPVLILIFVFMFIMDILFPAERLARFFKGGRRSTLWFVTIIAGIISTGSVYLWYPLLKDLQGKGMTPELIAVFIFNRAIKLQLIPIMIMYFGTKYVIVLTVVMALFSVLYGLTFKLFYDLKTT